MWNLRPARGQTPWRSGGLPQPGVNREDQFVDLIAHFQGQVEQGHCVDCWRIGDDVGDGVDRNVGLGTQARIYN